MRWHFLQGGRLEGDMPVGLRTITDEGKWWASATGVLCFQWHRWAQARKRCLIPFLADNEITGEHPKSGKKLPLAWKIKAYGPGSGPVVEAMKSPAPQQVARYRSPMMMRGPAVQSDKTPPSISVPATLSTDGSTVEVAGKVSDSSQIVELSVNGHPIRVSSGGTFSVMRGVPVGKSRIVVAAVDEWGNRSERTIDIRRQNEITVATRGIAPRRSGSARHGNSPFAGIHFGSYHAVVIGNNRYRYLRHLKSARNDADAVTEVLANDYGFKVTELADATRSQILGTLAKMRATLKPDDNLLIYYAGHGIVDSITEQGYWLPVDAEKENPANWISNTDLTTMLRAIRARHIMVVADSCYSGTLVRAASAKLKTSRDKVRWIKRMLGKRGRTALVSGGLEPVVDGGTGSNHSVFAQAFISALEQNRSVLEGHALFDEIKRPIALNADQTPQYSDIRKAGHEGGEFMFVRKDIQ